MREILYTKTLGDFQFDYYYENGTNEDNKNFKELGIHIANISGEETRLDNPFYEFSSTATEDGNTLYNYGVLLLRNPDYQFLPTDTLDFAYIYLIIEDSDESILEYFDTYLSLAREGKANFIFNSYYKNESVTQTVTVPNIEPHKCSLNVEFYESKTYPQQLLSIQTAQYDTSDGTSYAEVNPPADLYFKAPSGRTYFIMKYYDVSTYINSSNYIYVEDSTDFANWRMFTCTFDSEEPSPEGTETLDKVIVNKISKYKYDTLVANGTITQKMIKEQVWIFTDDQFVSNGDIINWNNKLDSGDVYTKAEIDTKFSEIDSTIGDIKAVLATLTIPTKFEEELRQI